MKHNRASKFVYNVLMYSRAAVPILALLAAVASSVRTFQAAAEIYIASGTSFWIAIMVGIITTIIIEGAIFIIALTMERQRIEWRQTKRKRQVMTVKTIFRSVVIRLGLKDAPGYDQDPESETFLRFVMLLVFTAALVANLYIGTRPLFEQTKSANLQAFMSNILNASADTQTRFITDIFFSLLPPVMTLLAGHLTARYASKVYASFARLTADPKAATNEQKSSKPEPRSKEDRLNASERLIEHLNAHPEDLKMSQRKLAQKLDISVGTVNAVFKRRLQINQNAPVEVERKDDPR